MAASGYYQWRRLFSDITDERTGERYLTPDCGHAVIQSHLDTPRGGYLRCRFCPKVPERPTLPSVFEGVAFRYDDDPHYDVDTVGDRNGLPVYSTLQRLEGKRVRVTVEVLPEGGTSDATG